MKIPVYYVVQKDIDDLEYIEVKAGPFSLNDAVNSLIELDNQYNHSTKYHKIMTNYIEMEYINAY